MESEARIVSATCDGGVIGANPSPIGGTWAYCFVDDIGGRIETKSGVLLPGDATLDGLPITNNVCEFLAIGKALVALPTGWSGIVYSDSLNALRRWFDNAACCGLPEGWARGRQGVLRRLGPIKWELLQGHPSRAELAAGVGKSGYKVSRHNVWCDEACIAQAVMHAATLGPAECERLLGKPYKRLLDSLAAPAEVRAVEAAEQADAEAGGPKASAAPAEAIARAGGAMGIWVIVDLAEEEMDLLGKPVVGSGGFQNLLRYLQAQCLKGNQLKMVKRTAHKVVQAARHASGDGGFQGRLKRVAEEAARQLGGYVPPPDVAPTSEEAR